MRRPLVSRRVRWWAPAVGWCAMWCTWAVSAGLARRWDLLIAYVTLAALVLLHRVGERAAFRAGWALGTVEAIVLPAEVHAGRVPAGVLRQTVTGDPVAEPWDPMPTPSSMLGGHDA